MNARGVALLEVLIALTILSVAGLSSVQYLDQLATSEAQSHAREQRLSDEDRLITAMSLLNREDLDRRLGRHDVGAWVVEVQRPRPTLYRVEVGSGVVPDLTTLLYRPEPHRDF